MKKDKPEMEDDLCSEYDLKSLRVRKFGSERQSFAQSTLEIQFDSFNNGKSTS